MKIYKSEKIQLKKQIIEMSQTPGVSVCQHCSRWAWNTHIITHAELFTQRGRKRDVELFTQWGRKRVGRVGGGVSCSSCSSHQPNWLQLSSKMKLTSINCMPAQLKLVLHEYKPLYSLNQIRNQNCLHMRCGLSLDVTRVLQEDYKVYT